MSSQAQDSPIDWRQTTFGAAIVVGGGVVGIVGVLVVSGAVVGASVTTTSGSGLFSLSP